MTAARFKRAIRRAREDFREAMAGTLAIDTAQFEAPGLLRGWLGALKPSTRELVLEDHDGDEEKWFASMFEENGIGYRLPGAPPLLVVNTDEPYIFEDSARSTEYTAAHEVGHHVTDNGIPSYQLQESPIPPSEQIIAEQDHLAELAADGFAVPYALKNRALKKPDFKRIADVNAVEVWMTTDITHLTFPVIDELVVNAARVDYAALSPAGAADLADACAERHRRDADEIAVAWAALKLTFMGEDPERMLRTGARQPYFENLADVFRTADRESLEGRVAARVLRLALDNGALPLMYGGSLPVRTDTKFWRSLRPELAR